MRTVSKLSTLSGVVAALAVLAAALGPALIQLGWLAPIRGFELFYHGVLLGVPAALLLGVAALLHTRSASGRAGRGRAWVGIAAAAALLGLLVLSAAPGWDAPLIHDVTTDPEDPPLFSEAVRHASDRLNGVDYPDGGADVPGQQRVAFPDLAPIALDVPPAVALELSRRAAEALGWTLTRVDPQALALEAYDVTPVFRFVDDVAVRVRPAGAGSILDVRSNSRVGEGDLGANAARIRAFRDALRAGG